MIRAVVFAAAAVLGGCASVVATGGGEPARITGTVSYMPRIALPPTATLTVRLVDVSRVDAPSVTLAEQVIPTTGKQVPFAFEIPFDPARIEARNSYAVQARIEDAGRLLFISDRRYPVITQGAPHHVVLELRAVGGSAPK
jgi:putative lipoprotein